MFNKIKSTKKAFKKINKCYHTYSYHKYGITIVFNYCPFCGESQEDKLVKFCPFCGKPF